MKRDEFLDCLKGILILLVVVGHSIQFIFSAGDSFWENAVFKAIYLFHMPAFMAVAGYLSFHSITTKPASTLIRARLHTCILPTLVWAVFAQSLLAAAGQLRLTDLPLAIGREALERLWFLWALFAATLLVATAGILIRQRAPLAISLCLLVLAVPDGSNVTLIKYTFPFFVAGFLLAGSNPPTSTTRRSTLLLACTLPLTALCFHFWKRHTYVYNSGMSLADGNGWTVLFRFAAGCVASTAFILTVRAAFTRIPAPVRNALASAGRDSIHIYILQTYFFWAYAGLRQRGTIPAFAPPMAGALAIFAGVALGFSFLIAGRLLSRNQRLSGLLFGRSRRSTEPVAPDQTAA